MQRVIEQGDFRPMAGSPEAMQDLKNILASRENSYARAQHQLDTSSKSLELTFIDLRDLVRAILPITSRKENAV
jgi:XRE family aerobic/anaerobic benzoate catabolism transcriptional regulator